MTPTQRLAALKPIADQADLPDAKRGAILSFLSTFDPPTVAWLIGMAEKGLESGNTRRDDTEAQPSAWRDIIVPKLKPEARYLVYCEVELDRNYRRKQWFTASYHTDGDKKAWFIIEHPSYWLNKFDADHRFSRSLLDPSAVLAIKPLPLPPSVRPRKTARATPPLTEQQS
jgi:hypothetical protein